MEWFDRLYFGTWQLGGQFKQLSSAQIKALLNFALKSGIRRFDTAAVYGNGQVEEMLGACLPQETVIVTKVPALSKPELNSSAPIQNFYKPDLIHQSVQGSLKRLRRESVDIVLLHNWHPTWSFNAVEVLTALDDLKKHGLARQVGVSLPDSFSAHIDGVVLSHLDVIETPFNPRERWLLQQLPHLLQLKKEVLLRSLFCQGRLLKEGYTTNGLLREALALNTSVVIGMTTEEQVTENISHTKGG